MGPHRHCCRRQDASTQARDPFEALRNQGVAYVHFALANPERSVTCSTGSPLSSASGCWNGLPLADLRQPLESLRH